VFARGASRRDPEAGRPEVHPRHYLKRARQRDREAETRERYIAIARKMKSEQGIEALILGGTDCAAPARRDRHRVMLLDTAHLHVERAGPSCFPEGGMVQQILVYSDSLLLGQGIAALVAAIRGAPIEPGMPQPPVLVMAPPPIGDPKGPSRRIRGRGAIPGLAEEYRKASAELGCHFFDARTVTPSSRAGWSAVRLRPPPLCSPIQEVLDGIQSFIVKRQNSSNPILTTRHRRKPGTYVSVESGCISRYRTIQLAYRNSTSISGMHCFLRAFESSGKNFGFSYITLPFPTVVSAVSARSRSRNLSKRVAPPNPPL